MTHDLFVWVDAHLAAHLIHDPAEDHWALAYTPAWRAHPAGFPLAPLLPWVPPPAGHASGRIKRFIEHLLPEGRALDVALHYNGLSRSNVFGLIRALGAETAGALRFSADDAPLPADSPTALREIPLVELAERITLPAHLPLNVWEAGCAGSAKASSPPSRPPQLPLASSAPCPRSRHASIIRHSLPRHTRPRPARWGVRPGAERGPGALRLHPAATGDA